MSVNQMKSFPYDLTNMVNAMGATYAAMVGSNLPAGLTFDLTLGAQRGVLSGQVPERPGTYQASYALYDSNQCLVIELSVYVVVGQSSEPQPEQACGKPISLQWDFGEVKGGTFHFLTAHQIPTSIQYQITSAGAIAAELLSSNLPGQAEFNLDLDSHIGSLSGFIPAQAAAYQLVFALYDQAECEVIHLTVLLNVEGSEPYNPPTVTPQPGGQVCLHVIAVVASSQMRTTTAYLPQYNEIPVEMVVNGNLRRTTAFDLCGTARTQFTIQAQADFWTQQEAHLIFMGWQRYNEQTQQWVPLSDDQKVTENPNIRITLQNGGSLRAVYQLREQG
jgi:hypothetical protein